MKHTLKILAAALLLAAVLCACGQKEASSDVQETPDETEVAVTPEIPEEPEKPTAETGASSEPETPETSAPSETPEVPEPSAAPETPVAPETPAVPETPAAPEAPAAPVLAETVDAYSLTFAKDILMSDLGKEVHKDIAEKTGQSLRLLTDESLIKAEYEILVGKSKREESVRLYERLEVGQYAVVVEGAKIIIGGKGLEPLYAAIDYFMTNYLPGGNAVSTPPATEYVADYPYAYFNDVLVGKSISIMGDSLIAGDDLGKDYVWCNKLAHKYDMTLNNYGINGNCVGESEKSLGTPMYRRYQKMAEADILMVEGGRNDFTKKVPLGTVTDITGNTFCGAINIIISGLQAMYPDKLILFSTCWYNGEANHAYSEAMKAVCAARGVPCFDAADFAVSGVYTINPAWRAQYCLEPDDVNHLNEEGMWLVLPAYEKFIAEEAEKFFR